MPTPLENTLQGIYNKIESEHGQKLTLNERLEALITVKALMAIAKDSKALSQKNNVYFIHVRVNNQAYTVPIHLEEYHRAGIPRQDREKALLAALPEAFVRSYDVVVKSDKREAVKIFLSKLGGNCIDARTRSAMDYAAKCDDKPITFSDCLTLCAEESANLYGDRHSYYSTFTVLLTKYWKLPYSKDTAATSPCQDDGIFDASCFELLHKYLNLVIPYDEEEEEDPTQWLAILERMGSKEQLVFVSFVIFSAIKEDDRSKIALCLSQIGAVIKKQAYIGLDNLYFLFESLNASRALLHEDEAALATINAHEKKIFGILIAEFRRWWPYYWSNAEVDQLYKFFTDDRFLDKVVATQLLSTDGRLLYTLANYIYTERTLQDSINFHAKLAQRGLLTDHANLFEQHTKKRGDQRQYCEICRLNITRQEHMAAMNPVLRKMSSPPDRSLKVNIEALSLYVKLDHSFKFSTLLRDRAIAFSQLKELGQLLIDIRSADFEEATRESIIYDILQIMMDAITAFYADGRAWRDDSDQEFIWEVLQLNSDTLPNFLAVNGAVDTKRKMCARLLFLAQRWEQSGRAIQQIRNIYQIIRQISPSEEFTIAETNFTERVRAHQSRVSSELDKLKRKQTSFAKDGHDRAKDVLETLVSSLEDTSKKYFEDGVTEMHAFTRNVSEAVDIARPELHNHRGCKQILGNIILAVVTGGVGFLVAASINKVCNNRFLFFHSTDSREKMNKFVAESERRELAPAIR